jgi:hypothetical protein
MGDSHAEHWLPAVDRIGRDRGWKVIAMVKPACPVADVDLVSSRLKRQYTECADWRRAMLRRILALRPDAVILSSYDNYLPADGGRSASGVTPASWREGIRRTYGVLSRASITTLVIRDVPRVGFDVPGCLSRRASHALFTGKPCEYDRERSLNRRAVQAQTEAARGMRHVALVDMNDRICSGPRCQVVQRGAIVYRDSDHLTATFSQGEATVLGDRIEAALGGSPARLAVQR